MKNKNKVLIIGLIILIILLASYTIIAKIKSVSEKVAAINSSTVKGNSVHSVIYDYEQYKNLPIEYAHAQYQYDMSTPEKTMGVINYAFVGKINGILRTEYRYPSKGIINDEVKILTEPYTIYSVTVISNIKGELVTTKDIEVAQCGGLQEDTKSYVFLENMGLLNVGEYYILMPFTDTDGTLVISNPQIIVPLGNLEENDAIKELSVGGKSALKTIENTNLTKIVTETVEKEIASGQRVGTTPLELIDTYVKAAENSVVPEDFKTTTTTSIYDTKMNDK